MSDLRRETPGYHPPLESLLAYLEDDLDDYSNEHIAAHVRQCWQCMAELEDLKRGIYSFMQFREKILIPGIPIDSRVTKTLPKMAKPVRDGRPAIWPWLDRFLARPIWGIPFRPTWIAALISLVVIGALLELSVVSPPPLAAKEFLKNVQTALTVCRKVEQGKIVHQRVRVKRGSSIAERKVIRGATARVLNAAPTTLAWAAAMKGPITWDDPLDFDSFVRWRDRQQVSSENVSTSPDLFTLTVRAQESIHEGPPIILTASLTVRKSDWHIISKRVEREGEPSLEASEIAYEVRDLPSPGDVPAAGLDTSLPATSKASVREPLRIRKESNGAELDSAEIDVRTALFHSRTEWEGAEVTPSIRRIQNSIAVEGVISSPERRRQLHLTLMGIPHTVDRIAGAVALPLTTRRTRSMHSLIQGHPTSKVQPAQLREMLIEKLGNEQNATDFSNQISNASENVFSLTVQYRDLAKRYQGTDEEALPVQARADLEDLARQIEHVLRTELQEERTALTPVLGPATTESADVKDRWQIRAETLFQLASLQEKAISQLFATTDADAPEANTPDGNLKQLQQTLQKMLSLRGSN